MHGGPEQLSQSLPGGLLFRMPDYPRFSGMLFRADDAQAVGGADVEACLVALDIADLNGDAVLQLLQQLLGCGAWHNREQQLLVDPAVKLEPHIRLRARWLPSV